MSRTAKVWRSFPHEHAPERCFRLPVGGLLDLKDRTGYDPDDIVKLFCPETEDENELETLADLIDDAALQSLIYAILRVSLEWGGTVSAQEAELIVRDLRNARAGIAHFPLAIEILRAALTATEEDPFPKYPRKFGAKNDDDEPGGSVWRQYYRFSGATGLDPQTLGHMSLWQYAQYAYGKFESTATLDSDTITEDEEAALHSLLDKFEGVTFVEEVPESGD